MDEVLVIRKVTSQSTGPTFGTRSGEDDAVHVDVVSTDDVFDLRRDKTVEIAARAMPLRLIRPYVNDKERQSPQKKGSLECAWGITATGAAESSFHGDGTCVAVLDTGIDASHQAFERVNIVEKDFTGSGTKDIDGHGTHCAGTIFGQDCDGLRIGVARKVSKALIGKVLGEGAGGTTAVLKEAIEWSIDEGANVISMSLGIDFPGYVDHLVETKDLPVAHATSAALQEFSATIRFFDRFSGLLRSQENAALILAASGNESSYEYPIHAALPSSADGFLSVGAVERKEDNFKHAAFSNIGAKIGAPGVDVASARIGGGITFMSGTSMATPHVAGIALLWAEKQMSEYDGRIDVDAVRADLISNSKIFGMSTDAIGRGMIQAP